MGAVEQLIEAVKMNQVVARNPIETPIDSSAVKLARVQDELIERMTGNDDPKAVSALAQALKNVREVYHLVTGQAKPGTLQPDKRNNRRQPSVQSLPEPDDTPQHVVPPSNPTSDVNGNGV